MAKRASYSSESAQYLSDALHSASDAIWITAPDQSLAYTNEAAVRFHAEFFGTQAVVGEPADGLYPPALRGSWSDRYRAALDGETVYALETRQADEGDVCYELVFERVQAAGTHYSVVVIARSITGRRRTVMGTTVEARAIVDSDTCVLFANPHFRALIGLAEDTPISSLRLRDLLDPDDVLHLEKAITSATEDPARLDRLRIIDLNGSVHETVGTIARSPDSGHLVLAFLDISEQIETELRLEQHAEHLRALHTWAAELNAYMEQPEVLYQRSLELLSNTVRFDTASVQLLKRDQLEIVACKGFPDAKKVIGLCFPSDTKFPNWHVVTSREAIAVTDVAEDYPHFHAQADTYDSGHISSWLGVPLGVRDEVLGMVALDRTDIAPFTDDEERLVATMAEHIAVAVHNSQLFRALLESEEQLLEANHQKEVLLRELHHRSKNNMQMISSLLSLGAAAVSVEEDGRVLDEVRMRIQSLAAVHEELYRSDNLDRVDLSDYARRLTQMIVSSYGRPGVSVGVDAQEMAASIDVSVPFGLILSELILNSYKHAFPDQAGGTIRVELSAEDGAATLVVQDDGGGLTREKWGNSQEGIGMQLVESLVDQIDGSIDLAEGPGTRWILQFPLGRPHE
ncbi:MAG: histidine kinase dimerization/phosphoacceptor domain -containing protein [Spirochaetia bacterium]